MQHLVLTGAPPPGETLELPQRYQHYLINVRRLTVGAILRYTDGVHYQGEVEIAGHAAGRITLRILTREESTQSHGTLTVYVPLLKGKSFDQALRGITELGVDHIVPLLTERCVRRREEGSQRWHAIIQEGCQQSGRLTLPELHPICSIPQIASPVASPADPANRTAHRWIAFHESGEALLEAHWPREPEESGEPTQNAGDWRILIGPEGGLTDGEVAQLHAAGWHVRRLDLPVLRAVTAAIAATAIVQHIRTHYTDRT